MEIIFIFIILIMISIIYFNKSIQKEYYNYHQIYEISDNYKKNNKDPFY